MRRALIFLTARTARSARSGRGSREVTGGIDKFALGGQSHVVSLLLAESVHAGKECHGLAGQRDDGPGAAGASACPGWTLSHPAPLRDLESHLQRGGDGPCSLPIRRR